MINFCPLNECKYSMITYVTKMSCLQILSTTTFVTEKLLYVLVADSCGNIGEFFMIKLTKFRLISLRITVINFHIYVQRPAITCIYNVIGKIYLACVSRIRIHYRFYRRAVY